MEVETEAEAETETETEAEREQDEYMAEAAGQSKSPIHDRCTLTTLNEVQPHGGEIEFLQKLPFWNFKMLWRIVWSHFHLWTYEKKTKLGFNEKWIFLEKS